MERFASMDSAFTQASTLSVWGSRLGSFKILMESLALVNSAQVLPKAPGAPSWAPLTVARL